MKRVEKEDYPLRAVREAIVNAIIHRDYQIIGSEIHIDMFDDRLEITSPGGMLDGSFVQDLEVEKISSMRRNRIISDIFNRLNYMERRGSGLIRIKESYKDTVLNPVFYSDASSFRVIFPNKSYIGEKSKQRDNSNVISDNDYFFLKMHKSIPSSIRKNTFNQVNSLFAKFTFQHEFKREDIEELLNIKKTRAIDILSLLIKCDLVDIVDSNKYKFKK